MSGIYRVNTKQLKEAEVFSDFYLLRIRSTTGGLDILIHCGLSSIFFQANAVSPSNVVPQS